MQGWVIHSAWCTEVTAPRVSAELIPAGNRAQGEESARPDLGDHSFLKFNCLKEKANSV